MATNQPRERERAGMLPGADAADVPAERGKPDAEHGLYGMVRQGSTAAEGLTERQIRGVEPMPEQAQDKPPAP